MWSFAFCASIRSLSSFSISSSNSLMSAAIFRSVAKQVSTHPTLSSKHPNISLQSRSSAWARSARFASTAAKQQTLKERLAELIPQELEQVRTLPTTLPVHLLTSYRSRPSVLSMAKNHSVPSSSTSSTGNRFISTLPRIPTHSNLFPILI